MSRFAHAVWVLLALLLCSTAPSIRAQLAPANVLIIFNDPGDAQTSDGYQIYAHYLTKRPGALGLNLDDPSLLPGRVTYAEFVEKIRDPIRTHLTDSGLTETVRVLLLTKGIPHQIDDINVPGTGLGNSGGGIIPRFVANNATFASVDSELTLLYHDLSENEADGNADSGADNFVLNPYFGNSASLPVSSAIATLAGVTMESVAILDDELEEDYSHWTLSPSNPGLIYLTARLDGNTVNDVTGMIDCAATILIDPKRFAALFDGNGGTLDHQQMIDNDPLTEAFSSFDAVATELMDSDWENVTSDHTSQFHLGAHSDAFFGNTAPERLRTISDPVIYLSSLGANHHSGSSELGWASTYFQQLPHGAIFNTFESYNARKFGGVSPHHEQAQLADWIAIGGTLGLGHVWEPFTLSVAWNQTLQENFYSQGLTWVESAWSSIPVLSWQNLVLGDPLAKATLLSDVPKLSLSLSPDPESALPPSLTEASLATHTVTITADAPVTGDLSVNLSLVGATLDADYTTNIDAFESGTVTTVVLPEGQATTSFDVTVLDDADEEFLEILTVSLNESSLDTNGDGFGEAYGFVSAEQTVQVPIADTPYWAWSFQHYGLAQDGSRDTDLDGLAQLWEYFIQSDPKTSFAAGRIDPLTVIEASLTGFTLSFKVPKTFPSDLRLSLQRSNTELEAHTWSEILGRTGDAPWDIASGTVVDIDSSAGPDDTLSVTLDSAVRGFIRFNLESFSTP